VRVVQAFRKLAKNNLLVYSQTDSAFIDVNTKALLESSGRWISERVGFNARRVLLTEKEISPQYRVVKIGSDTVEHILYSEQRNVLYGASYLFDYTLLDKTHSAQTVSFSLVPSASGMGGVKTEVLSAEIFPVHMVRFASTKSEEVDHVEYSRLYAFAPNNISINDDMELQIGGERYLINESEPELLCIRLALTKR